MSRIQKEIPLGDAAANGTSPFRTTIRWGQIIAQAESLRILGSKATLIVAAAGTIDGDVSAHDILNTQICTYVFSQSPRLHHISKFHAFVRDKRGVTRRVGFDPRDVELLIKRFLDRKDRGSVPFPAPLLAFLIRSELEKVRLICCKSNNSQ